MSETILPYHERLRLLNVTVFRDATFEFSPGINALIGENGTGKTHAMKALYAWGLCGSVRSGDAYQAVARECFGADQRGDLVRTSFLRGEVSGYYSDITWSEALSPVNPHKASETDSAVIYLAARPVFIPAMDMMGHTKGFGAYYDEFRLDFPSTTRDIVNLMLLERREPPDWAGPILASLEEVLGGEVVLDDSQRFYLVRGETREAMPMVAEGLRKIATLLVLVRNGSLRPGTTLFWDEPEVNLNPVLMDEVVGALLALARHGVQVILATHSYVILEEIALQAEAAGSVDLVRYHLLRLGEDGTEVVTEDDLRKIPDNPILRQYESILKRKMRRALERPAKLAMAR